MKYIASKIKVKKAKKHHGNHDGLSVKSQQAVSFSYENIDLDADGYKKIEKIYNKESNKVTFYSQTESIALLKKKNGYTFFKENLNFFNAFENKIFISPVNALSSQEKIMGVFAKEAIDNQYRYKYCAIYQTEKIKSEGRESDAAYYTFTLNDEYDLSAEEKRTWPALVNSASSRYFANLEAEIQNGQVIFKVLKDIKPNQQLLIWYGDTYTYPEGEKRFLTPDDTYLSAEERYRMSANLYNKKPFVDLELNALLGYGPNTVFIVPKKAQMGNIHMPYYARKEDGFESQQQNLTHLHLACWQGNLELVSSLQKLGANIHYQLLERGFTPLHLLMLSKHKLSIKFEIFEYILETYSSMDLFLKDQEDRDILTHLIITNQFDLLKKILDKYATKFKRNKNENMLYSFLKYGSSECIDQFVPQYFKNNDYKKNEEALLALHLELQTNEPASKRTRKVSQYIQAHFPEGTRTDPKTFVNEIEKSQTDSEFTVNTDETNVQFKLPSPNKTDVGPNMSLKTMGFFTHQEPLQQQNNITTPTHLDSLSCLIDTLEQQDNMTTPSHSEPLRPVRDASQQQNNMTTPSHPEPLRPVIDASQQQNNMTTPSYSEPLRPVIDASQQQNNMTTPSHSASLRPVIDASQQQNNITIPSHLEPLRPFIECIIFSFRPEYRRRPNNYHFEYIAHSLASHDKNDLLFRMLILYFYIPYAKKIENPHQFSPFLKAHLIAVVMTMPMYCLHLEKILAQISQEHFGINLFPCFNSLDFCLWFQSKLVEIRRISESYTIETDHVSGHMFIRENGYNQIKLSVELLDENPPVLQGPGI